MPLSPEQSAWLQTLLKPAGATAAAPAEGESPYGYGGPPSAPPPVLEGPPLPNGHGGPEESLAPNASDDGEYGAPGGPAGGDKLKLVKDLLGKGVKTIKYAAGKVVKVIQLLDLVDDVKKIVPEIWHVLQEAAKVAHQDIKDGVIYLAGIARKPLEHVANTTGDIVADAEQRAYKFGIRWAKVWIKPPPSAGSIKVSKKDIDFVGPEGKGPEDFKNFDYPVSSPVLPYAVPLTDRLAEGPVMKCQLQFCFTHNKHFIRGFYLDVQYGAGDIPDDCAAEFTVASTLGQASGHVATIDIHLSVSVTYKGRPVAMKSLRGRAGGNGVAKWG